jgi:hypothetical protein
MGRACSTNRLLVGAKVGSIFVDKRRSLRRYSSIADLGQGVIIVIIIIIIVIITLLFYYCIIIIIIVLYYCTYTVLLYLHCAVSVIGRVTRHINNKEFN